MVPAKSHYLVIVAARRGFDWHCTCGSPKAKGNGKTELACEVSFDRHMYAVWLRARQTRYDGF